MSKTKAKQAEFTKWFGPLLDALRDLGGAGRPKEATEKIAKNLSIPDSVLEEIMKSGTPRFANQVAWARQYLVWEGLLEDNTRGIWTLTEKGRRTRLTDGQKLQELFEEKQLGVKPKIIHEVDLKFFKPFLEIKKEKK
jgi:restriction system protein